MAMLSEIFEERVAAAMAAPVGACCYDLLERSAHQPASPSTSGSTRASSPGGHSSASCGDASCGPSSPCSNRSENPYEMTLAQRRGLRAAILCDLGVDVDSTANCVTGDSPQSTLHALTETPTSKASTGCSVVHLTGTRPAPGPRALVQDASQRSPMVRRGIAQASPGTPHVNSRISTNCLGSSPGSGGDASQRSVGSAALQQPFQSAALNIPPRMVATPTAASALSTPTGCTTPQTRATLLGTVGKNPMLAASDASCRAAGVAQVTMQLPCKDAHQINTASNEELTQILKHSGLEALSSEELAARLCAAAPTEYED